MGLFPDYTVAGGVESTLFGNGDHPGWLGTGQYAPKTYDYDPNAFSVPGYADTSNRLLAGAQEAANRGVGSPFRDQQIGLSSQLYGQAMGTAPSIADAQMRAGMDQNMRNAMSMAASQQFGAMSPGASMRLLANQRAQLGQQGAQASGIMRLQEQQAAANTLGGVLSAGRTGDTQAQALNDALVRYYTQAGMDLNQAQAAAQMGLQQLKGQQQQQNNQLSAQAYANSAKANSAAVAGAGQILGIGPKGGPAGAGTPTAQNAPNDPTVTGNSGMSSGAGEISAGSGGWGAM